MKEKLAKVKLIAMDVDGTLTDGSMVFMSGDQLKVFNARDGLGMRIALSNGLHIAWITGNICQAINERAETLGITHVYQGVWQKRKALKEISIAYGVSYEEMAYVGDDINDIPAFDTVGVSFAVNDASEEARLAADIVTSSKGGHGAVREVIERILKAQGEWEAAVKKFLDKLDVAEPTRIGPEAIN
ncbi:MAG: HAD hydrolase family protein [Armatimonadota bacterium]